MVEEIFGPAPGSFLNTTNGSTHYIYECSIEGRAEEGAAGGGQLVILCHGLGSSLSAWDTIAAALVAAGNRVLRYDFYDRGYSESSPERYPITKLGVHPLSFTIDVYLEQLNDVLRLLGLEGQRAVLVGHSTGGAVCISHAAQNPDVVSGLILLDTVCLPASKPLAARVADLPLIGGPIVSAFGAKSYIKFARASTVDPEGEAMGDWVFKLTRNVTENPRYFSSIRSTNGNCRGFVDSLEPEYTAVCRRALTPIHLIWGCADVSVPYTHCERLKEIAMDCNGCTVSELSFEGMPHNVHLPSARPGECAESIVEFVEKVTAGTIHSDPMPDRMREVGSVSISPNPVWPEEDELLFKQLDKSSDGTLSKQVVYALIKQRGYAVTPGYLDGVWMTLDVDGNDALDINDFARLMKLVRARDTA